MHTFRHIHTKTLIPDDEVITSEEYTHNEEMVNGQKHIIGTKKTINLCDNDWAKTHFPDPKDYTLENLINSGAGLQEVTTEIENGDNIIMSDAEKLSQTLSKKEE